LPSRVLAELLRGWGLRAKEDIKKGRYVMEYCGELIAPEEEEQRREEAVEAGTKVSLFVVASALRLHSHILSAALCCLHLLQPWDWWFVTGSQ
jgi:hypothetical protein